MIQTTFSVYMYVIYSVYVYAESEPHTLSTHTWVELDDPDDIFVLQDLFFEIVEVFFFLQKKFVSATHMLWFEVLGTRPVG